MNFATRATALSVGTFAAGLSAYGAFEGQLKLEGSVNYLVVAAPFVVAAAALIPVFAEQAWKGNKLKSLLWWLVLIPAAALAFFAAAERVHLSKAGLAAEQTALRNAVRRAETDLADAKAAVLRAEADEKAARSLKACKSECRAKWEAATAATRERQTKAADAVTKAETASTAEAPYSAPVWLLPACLDLIAFMAIWTGFSGMRVEPVKAEAAPAKKNKPKRTKQSAPSPQKLAAVARKAGNDNVHYLPPAA